MFNIWYEFWIDVDCFGFLNNLAFLGGKINEMASEDNKSFLFIILY